MSHHLTPWLLHRGRTLPWPSGWLEVDPLHRDKLQVALGLAALDAAQHTHLGHVLPDWARLDCALMTGLNVGLAHWHEATKSWQPLSWLAAIPTFDPSAPYLVHRFMAHEGNSALLARTWELALEAGLSRWRLVGDLAAPGVRWLLQQRPHLVREVLASTTERPHGIVLSHERIGLSAGKPLSTEASEVHALFMQTEGFKALSLREHLFERHEQAP